MDSLATIIQLAIAPVFLLAGIAGFLGVMSGRLGRVIDRVRVVEPRLQRITDATQKLVLERELALLRRRAKVTNRAIALCTGAGLMVCCLVLGLFAADYLDIDLAGLIGSVFAAAMIMLIVSLLLFLFEVTLATRTLGIAREYGAE